MTENAFHHGQVYEVLVCLEQIEAGIKLKEDAADRPKRRTIAAIPIQGRILVPGNNAPLQWGYDVGGRTSHSRNQLGERQSSWRETTENRKRQLMDHFIPSAGVKEEQGWGSCASACCYARNWRQTRAGSRCDAPVSRGKAGSRFRSVK